MPLVQSSFGRKPVLTPSGRGAKILGFRIPTYCHIVLITSLVWILIDVMLILYFTAGSDDEVAARFERKQLIDNPVDRRKKFGLENVSKPSRIGPVAQPDPSKDQNVGDDDLEVVYQRDLHPPEGPGEKGAAVVLSAEEEKLSQETYKQNQFNLLICDKISPNRSLADFRPAGCSSRKLRSDLAEVSVVIVFHEEAWCTLTRSVYSIINRSPSRLIKEIVLVDDASTKEHLKQKLDHFVASVQLLKLVRLNTRSGLIRARLAGAQVARGEVLVFLDSHIEASQGWLPPLLHEIREDRTRVTVPTIDNINLDTFQYSNIEGAPQVGGFTWSLTYYWYQMTKSEKIRVNGDNSLPVRSPAMAGGLFAIDREYFYEVGSYDSQMEIWGGENVEMSLRIWQCGGSIWILPCSKVGHVFRKQSPYGWPGGVSNILGKNNRRLAEVWLDEYKMFWFFINPSAKSVEYGDVSERKALRAKLQCKSFHWFIQNVWPESSYNLDVHFLGQIENPQTKLCIDTMGRKQEEKVGLIRCHHQGGHQAFAFTKANELRSDDDCLDASKKDDFVVLYRCHRQGGNQYWDYDEHATRHLRHRPTNQCLSAISHTNSDLKLEECDPNNQFQEWQMENASQLTQLLEKYRT